MDLEERSRLSYYQEIAPLDAEHDVRLVRHSESGQLFVRKTLVNYQPEIFLQLKADPVPNMPRIVEAAEDEDRLIVIETYLAGRTLQDIVNERGPLPLLSVCRIGRQLCGILSELHGRGIIHRDVKPSNIILSEDGVVKLLDLDAAKIFRSDESRDTRLIGTHGYAAPEQYGFGASSPATDIYAVGVLLNVLAAGDLPGVRMPADEGLCAVISCCTRMEPKERYRSVEELAEALCALEQSAAGTLRTAQDEAGSVHTEPEIKSKGNSRRLPGFRSGKLWKMILAVLWYGFTVLLAVSFLITPPEGNSRFDSIAEFCMVLLFGILLPVLLFNYRGIWQKTHIDRIKSLFWREAAAVFLTALIVFAVMLLFAFVGSILIGMGVIPPE